MKSLRKLLWIQLFLLSILVTASLLVEFYPSQDLGGLTSTQYLNETVSSR